jgi:hypothetical protein
LGLGLGFGVGVSSESTSARPKPKLYLELASRAVSTSAIAPTRKPATSESMCAASVMIARLWHSRPPAGQNGSGGLIQIEHHHHRTPHLCAWDVRGLA